MPVVSWSADETAISCLICEKENSAEALVCGGCAAPMALVQESVAQGRDPQIISVVGESNVGKTVYLGFLLDMLSRRAKGYEAIPKGAYSIDLQQNVIAHMAQRRFPPKTPMEPNQWHWAYYQTRKDTGRKTKWYDLVMPDMAGEAIAAEVDNPDTFRVIRSLLTKSSGILLLVDAALAANGSPRPDFFALKLMSYMDTMFGGRRDQRIQAPVAVVLCKSDYCPEAFDNPRKFVQANLNRLWNLCESRFSSVEFFACTAVGSLAYSTGGEDGDDSYVQPIPLHTSLRGVLEPFEWIINRAA